MSAYRLTDAGLARYRQALTNLAPIEERASSDCDDDADGAQTIDAAVAELEKLAGARAALESAGMKTREFVVFGFALFQAGMAKWALDQPGATLPPDVQKANVDFYRKHEAALQQLGESSRRSDCDDA